MIGKPLDFEDKGIIWLFVTLLQNGFHQNKDRNFEIYRLVYSLYRIAKLLPPKQGLKCTALCKNIKPSKVEK